jgi:hypothetical protein
LVSKEVYLFKEGLQVHPFFGESLEQREICIKSLKGSSPKEFINLHSVNYGVLQS